MVVRLRSLAWLRSVGQAIYKFVTKRPLWTVLTSCWCLSTLLGWWLYEGLLTFSASLLVALGIGTAWPWICIRGVTAQLSFGATRITEGQTTFVALRLVNRLPWPVHRLTLHIGNGNARGDTLTLHQVPRWSDCEFRWDYEPLRRGIHPLQQIELSSSYPFGVWEAGRRVSIPQPLIVWPRTFPVKLPQWWNQPDSRIGESNHNIPGYGGEVLGVRYYRQGEPRKRIHWPQSLRLGQLVICEYEAETRVCIVLVLDSNPNHWPEADSACLREWAIRWTASFAKRWLEMGYAVGLVTADNVVLPETGQFQLCKILDTLAAITDTDQADLSRLLTVVERVPRTWTVIFTHERTIRAASIWPVNRDTSWVIFCNKGASPTTPLPQQSCLWVTDPELGLAAMSGIGVRIGDGNGA